MPGGPLPTELAEDVELARSRLQIQMIDAEQRCVGWRELATRGPRGRCRREARFRGSGASGVAATRLLEALDVVLRLLESPTGMLAYETNGFDLAPCSEMIEHLSAKGRGSRRERRCGLRPGNVAA